MLLKKTKKYEDEDLEYTVAQRDKSLQSLHVNHYKNLEELVKK